MGFKSSDKPLRKHKKGLWSPEEDQRLKDYILQHGIGCWTSVPLNAGKFKHFEVRAILSSFSEITSKQEAHMQIIRVYI